jgi:hypothetical protein
MRLSEKAFEKWIDFPFEKKIPFYTMSCKHLEDVCEKYLEKVHITTEDSPPNEDSEKKIMTLGAKIISNRVFSSFRKCSYLGNK